MAEGQIIVTGASKGIGLAIAEELARRDYQVVSLSRSGGGIGKQIICDMTDENAVRAAFSEVRAGFRRLRGGRRAGWQ